MPESLNPSQTQKKIQYCLHVWYRKLHQFQQECLHNELFQTNKYISRHRQEITEKRQTY